jgi:uncharacterized protein YxjI
MTTHYKIRQKLVFIGDDFWIENQNGQKVFKMDGKVLCICKTSFLKQFLLCAG